MRTPAQKPYFSARLIFINASLAILAAHTSRPWDRGEKCTPPSSKQGESGPFCPSWLPI
jgi:hypothetical protein